jgi:hypothetical protein
VRCGPPASAGGRHGEGWPEDGPPAAAVAMQDGLMMGLQRMDLQRRPRRTCASRRMGSEQAHGKADDCFGVRMRGLEPPPSCLDTDLNRARLPIPPHPRAGEDAKISHRPGTSRSTPEGVRGAVSHGDHRTGLLERFASLGPADRAPLSSRGLGRRPLMAETGVRIPVAVWQSNGTRSEP